MSGNPVQSDALLDEVERLTRDLFVELTKKWKSMYKYTEEFRKEREVNFIKFLKIFYNDIAESEEEKRVKMIEEMDAKLEEYYRLKKDLHLSSGHDMSWKEEREPYTLFLNEIKSTMKKYEELRDERLAQYASLRSKEEELCELLEIPPIPDFTNAIPTDDQLQEIEMHIFELRETQIKRMDFYNEAKERIINLMRDMEYNAEDDFEIEIISSNEDTFIPSTSKIDKLKELKQHIEREYEQKHDYRTCLLDKLVKLWDRIKIEEDERTAFLARYPNVSKSHIRAINEEIARCEEIKLANIKPIVEQLREQIVLLWDKLTYSDDQRKEFSAFLTDFFSEDVLTLHELEVERLEHFYQKYQHIYELADKRDELWQRMLHLDQIAMDKTRLFNNRGGQLLKEEKERKSLESNLPKVDKQLKTALAEFQSAEGKPFLWCGADLLEKITRDWEERLEAKESKKLARKVENQKQIEVEAKLGSRLMVSKRKMGTPVANGSEAKMRRRDDLGQTVVLKGGCAKRTPGRLPNIRTPLNISTSSIASYSHFQSNLNGMLELANDSDPDHSGNESDTDPPGESALQDGLEKSETRSALKEVGNRRRVPGIGHSSPTLTTPVGRKGTPASAIRSGSRNPSTIPRMATHRTRLHLDF